MKQSLVNYPNKFRVVYAGKNSPVVAISVSICAGAEQEPKNMSGVTHLIERLLKQNILSNITMFGGVVETRTDFEHIEITVSTLRPYILNTLIALSSAIFDFTPKLSSFEREKAKILSEIEKAKFNPTALLMSITQKQMYKGTGLATDVIGNEKTISSLTLDAVKEYYESILSADSIILSMVGDIFDRQIIENSVNANNSGNNFIVENNSKDSVLDEKWVIPSLDRLKSDNPEHTKMIPSFSYVQDLVNKHFYVRTLELKNPKRKKKTKYTVPERGFVQKYKTLNQTRFQISFPSAPYDSAGYKYGKLLEDYLITYLRMELANTEGVYGVNVVISQFKGNGHISILFAVDEDKAELVYNKVVIALRKVKSETVTTIEFNSLVTKYKTQVALKHEKITDLALRFNKWLYLKDKVFNLQNELIAIDSLSYNNFIYICKQTLDFSSMVVVCLGRKIENFNPFELFGGR